MEGQIIAAVLLLDASSIWARQSLVHGPRFSQARCGEHSPRGGLLRTGGLFSWRLGSSVVAGAPPRFRLVGLADRVLSRVYLGQEYWNDPLRMAEDLLDLLKSLAGGQGLSEFSCLLIAAKADIATECIRRIVQTVDAQHGLFVTWHPTALLWLADHALHKQDDVHSAILLTNIALGYRGVFADLRDVGGLVLRGFSACSLRLAPARMFAEGTVILRRGCSLGSCRGRW